MFWVMSKGQHYINIKVHQYLGLIWYFFLFFYKKKFVGRQCDDNYEYPQYIMLSFEKFNLPYLSLILEQLNSLPYLS